MYSSTEYSTISDLIINSDSLSASTLADSTIGSQHTHETEVAKEGGGYNITDRGYYSRRLRNGIIYLNITFFWWI